jgi:hypothetical protein
LKIYVSSGNPGFEIYWKIRLVFSTQDQIIRMQTKPKEHKQAFSVNNISGFIIPPPPFIITRTGITAQKRALVCKTYFRNSFCGLPLAAYIESCLGGLHTQKGVLRETMRIWSYFNHSVM